MQPVPESHRSLSANPVADFSAACLLFSAVIRVISLLSNLGTRSGVPDSLRTHLFIFPLLCELSLWPHDGQGERHSNSNRHLGEPMKRDLPWRTRPWHQHHDRQRYASKPIGGLIRSQQGTKQTQKENAKCEYEDARLEIACRYRANYGSKCCPHKPLPRNRKRCAQRRLRNHQRRDRRPVRLGQVEQPRG